jgi:hypothetical protein
MKYQNLTDEEKDVLYLMKKKFVDVYKYLSNEKNRQMMRDKKYNLQNLCQTLQIKKDEVPIYLTEVCSISRDKGTKDVCDFIKEFYENYDKPLPRARFDKEVEEIELNTLSKIQNNTTTISQEYQNDIEEDEFVEEDYQEEYEAYDTPKEVPMKSFEDYDDDEIDAILRDELEKEVHQEYEEQGILYDDTEEEEEAIENNQLNYDAIKIKQEYQEEEEENIEEEVEIIQEVKEDVPIKTKKPSALKIFGLLILVVLIAGGVVFFLNKDEILKELQAGYKPYNQVETVVEVQTPQIEEKANMPAQKQTSYEPVVIPTNNLPQETQTKDVNSFEEKTTLNSLDTNNTNNLLPIVETKLQENNTSVIEDSKTPMTENKDVVLVQEPVTEIKEPKLETFGDIDNAIKEKKLIVENNKVSYNKKVFVEEDIIDDTFKILSISNNKLKILNIKTSSVKRIQL